MNNYDSVKQRLIGFISFKKISQKVFSEKCGLSRGFVNNIVQSIQPKTMEKIVAQFPELNPAWLLTGEGQMIRGPERLTNKGENYQGTPVYDLDTYNASDSKLFMQEKILGYINLPTINKDAMIITASGDSMTPVINPGDKIAIREITNINYIHYGLIFFIVTKEYKMIKYIRKHPTDKDILILRSESKNYDDLEIHREQIIRLFVVESIISIKNKI